MKKTRYIALTITIIILVGTLFFIMLNPRTATGAILDVQCEPVKNVVDKRQGGAFTVKVTFKNIGDASGAWQVNVAFEGESNWDWQGTPQTLVLTPSKTATLTWTGSVPAEAEVGSTARLIVYFDNEVVPQNWWIHVLAGAELEIVQSEVS